MDGERIQTACLLFLRHVLVANHGKLWDAVVGQKQEGTPIPSEIAAGVRASQVVQYIASELPLVDVTKVKRRVSEHLSFLPSSPLPSLGQSQSLSLSAVRY